MSVEQELTNLKQIVEAAQSAAKEAQAAACAATARCRNLEAKVSDLISEAAFRHSYEDRAAAKRVGTQLYRWCYKRWEASGRWSDMQFDDVYKRWEEFTAEATDEEVCVGIS